MSYTFKHVIQDTAFIETGKRASDHQKKYDDSYQGAGSISSKHKEGRKYPFPEGKVSVNIAEAGFGIYYCVPGLVYSSSVFPGGHDEGQNVGEHHEAEDDGYGSDKGFDAYVYGDLVLHHPTSQIMYL